MGSCGVSKRCVVPYSAACKMVCMQVLAEMPGAVRAGLHLEGSEISQDRTSMQRKRMRKGCGTGTLVLLLPRRPGCSRFWGWISAAGTAKAERVAELLENKASCNYWRRIIH